MSLSDYYCSYINKFVKHHLFKLKKVYDNVIVRFCNKQMVVIVAVSGGRWWWVGTWFVVVIGEWWFGGGVG